MKVFLIYKYGSKRNELFQNVQELKEYVKAQIECKGYDVEEDEKRKWNLLSHNKATIDDLKRLMPDYEIVKAM